MQGHADDTSAALPQLLHQRQLLLQLLRRSGVAHADRALALGVAPDLQPLQPVLQDADVVAELVALVAVDDVEGFG